MVTNIILVGIGGLLGTIARYLVTIVTAPPIPQGFPYWTFAVNVIGCFAIGVIAGLSQRLDWLTPELRIFLTTGFCGGFTTFSAYSYESVVLIQDKDYFTFASYAILSFAVCLAATFAGLFLTKG